MVEVLRLNMGPVITQVEFAGDDFEIAEQIAKYLGYSHTAYTFADGFWGMFCLRSGLPGRVWRCCLFRVCWMVLREAIFRSRIP